MTDAPPPVQQADLDPETLFRLFRDIGSVTRLVEVVYKTGPQQHAPAPVAATDAVEQLRQAKALLLARKVAGVQLRYVYQGVEWWDTLMPGPHGGVRLVRMQQPVAAAA